MADFNIDVVFNGSYQFEKLQSDWGQSDELERDFIKNKPDLADFVADSVTTDELIMGGQTTTWDGSEGTLSTTLPDGGSLQHGKEIFDYYTNVDTVTLVEGDVVCIKQIPGNRKAVKRLDPSQRVDAFSVVGVVTVPTIAVNAIGRVTKIGHVTPYNTAGWSDNDSLWVSSANIGKLTNVQPDAGVYSVKVGHVVVSAVAGTIDVRIQVIPKVRDLSDMDGVPLNTEGQFYILQADGTFSANKNINDYYTKTQIDAIKYDKLYTPDKTQIAAQTDASKNLSVGGKVTAVSGFAKTGATDADLLLGAGGTKSVADFQLKNEKGQANGYASLGADGLVPSTQLPSFVDDVLEFASLASFPATGETGKIYVALDTNKTYRWSGSAYIYITSGAVDSVAGKTGVVTLVKADVGLGNVDNISDANKPISIATQTALNGKVNNTGNETIAGIKTFSLSPIIPTPNVGDLTKSANVDFVESAMLLLYTDNIDGGEPHTKYGGTQSIDFGGVI